MYDTVDYANSRLAGTIVRLLNGEPVTINQCHGRNHRIEVSYNFLSSGRPGPDGMLSGIDLTPVSLGWAEHSKRDCAYLARLPKSSDYRQGLRQSNYVSIFGCDKRHILPNSLSRTILDIYLSLDLSMDEASNTNKLTPFSRTFAIKPQRRGDDFDLFFKWFGIVGDVVNGQPHLSDQFPHLQESLEGLM